ncbi:hypothetical protein V3C99_017694 [Haemonchus contortus]|uniref:Protein AF-9 homolog n=1 Tax=Haemonchus contortus TaxID=6289 RepID=A0A7I5EEF0_HAECO
MSERGDMRSTSPIRAKGTQFVKPIVYGNIAKELTTSHDDENTHEWTLFLKPYWEEDLSTIISKVEFRLHDSYEPSLRVVEKPPYEVHERGWGEFKARIRVHFIDPCEKPLTIYHNLNLVEPTITLKNGTVCVVDEYYDEIVFQDPTALMYEVLTESANTMKTHDSSKFFTHFRETGQQQLKKLSALIDEMENELADLHEALKAAQALKKKTEAELSGNPLEPDDAAPAPEGDSDQEDVSAE